MGAKLPASSYQMTLSPIIIPPPRSRSRCLFPEVTVISSEFIYVLLLSLEHSLCKRFYRVRFFLFTIILPAWKQNNVLANSLTAKVSLANKRPFVSGNTKDLNKCPIQWRIGHINKNRQWRLFLKWRDRRFFVTDSYIGSTAFNRYINIE